MDTAKSNYDILISKLDRFVRKYYTNQLIRGALVWTGLILAVFLLYSLLEHAYFFDTAVRKFFFFSFFAVALGGGLFWIIRGVE